MKRLLLVLAVAACGGHRAPAPPPAPEPLPLDAKLTPYIESYGASWGEWHAMSGYVMVAQHDQPLYSRGFGYADRDAKRVPGPDTSFRIGSVTKQFTAAAIMLLQQDGTLSTADTIGRHLPDYPAVGAGVTLHQLLTHTSGIPSYTDDPAVMEARDRPITVDALLATFAAEPLDFAPGTSWAYSNSNYIVLGAIIEKVSGMSYADFLRTRVFEPAGLTRTVVGDAPGDPDRALGYKPHGTALAPAHAIDMSVPFAAGAVRSTANDLVRWHRALAGEAILTADSKREMYTPDQQSYAYGWGVDPGPPLKVGHDGGIDGFVTSYMRVVDPEEDLVVVVLSNNEGFPMHAIGDAALTVATGGTVEPIVEEPPLAPFDRAAADAVTGDWTLSEASKQALAAQGAPPEVIATIVTVTFTVVDDQLVMKPVGQEAVGLLPVAPDTYLQPEYGIIVTFAGAKATIEQGGATMAYSRE